MDLNDIVIFAHVVNAGSFVGASRALQVPKSTVSRRVSELEERLGARLLQRTTRKLHLTDVGQTFYQHARRVVAEVEEAERAVADLQQTPRGLIRVTIPLNFGFLAPLVASFMERHPEVEVELVGTDRLVDLVAEGFDLGIRAGRLDDSSLVVRRLGKLQSVVVASPVLLERAGAPSEPDDLGRLPVVAFGAGSERTRWRLTRDGKTATVEVTPRLVVNDFDFLAEAARAGLGVAVLPLFRCIDDLRQKRLRRLLTDWSAAERPLHAVYPSARHLSVKVKALVDHLQEHMTPPPWEA